MAPGGVIKPKGPEDTDFQAVRTEEVAKLKELETREAIEKLVAEVEATPRVVDPLAIQEVQLRGQMAKHGEKLYCANALSTVTEILEVAQRKGCPPPEPPPYGFKYAIEDCTFLEYDLRFMAGNSDVTAQVLAESLPDQITALPAFSLGCATFSGQPLPFEHIVGAWRDQFCRQARAPYPVPEGAERSGCSFKGPGGRMACDAAHYGF